MENELTWLRIVPVLLSYSKHIRGYNLETVHDQFLPNYFQFTIRKHILFSLTLHRIIIDTASLNNIEKNEQAVMVEL
jgi:dolichyl-phosphate-mannose--protein O-mannosyl transferase